MKHVFLITIYSIAMSCNFNKNNQLNSFDCKDTSTSLSWQDTIIDLGTIAINKKSRIVFHYKNNGEKPLYIQKIESTCGCTVINQFQLKPILPNCTDSIVGYLKINEPVGAIYKKIYVLANTKKQFYVLKVKATVVE
jgi:hypothetical protein